MPDTPVLPTLKTDSEYEVPLMQLFAMHRVATPYDVMTVFPVYFKYHNCVMRHLNRLTNQGYLRRHDYDANLRSYVYNITNVGYERCRDIPRIDLDRIPYRYEEPTGAHIDHELLITKTAICICQFIEIHQGIRLLEHGRFMLRSESVFADLVPDLLYVDEDRNGMMIRFVEVIVGEESMTRVRSKFEEYERWGQRLDVQQWLIDRYRRHGATAPQPEFQVHCIVESRNWKHTDAWKERAVLMQTFNLSPMMQGRVWTTTREALESALIANLSINHPIWHRGKDLLGTIRQRWQEQPAGQRTRFMDQCMRELPTYPLFA